MKWIGMGSLPGTEKQNWSLVQTGNLLCTQTPFQLHLLCVLYSSQEMQSMSMKRPNISRWTSKQTKIQCWAAQGMFPHTLPHLLLGYSWQSHQLKTTLHGKHWFHCVHFSLLGQLYDLLTNQWTCTRCMDQNSCLYWTTHCRDEKLQMELLQSVNISWPSLINEPFPKYWFGVAQNASPKWSPIWTL